MFFMKTDTVFLACYIQVYSDIVTIVRGTHQQCIYYLLFSAIYWFGQLRVFERLTSLLFLSYQLGSE